MIDITCSISPSRPVCLSHVLSRCLWFPLDFGQRIQQCGLRTKSLLFKTAATCIDQNWHKRCQSVRSTVSPSLPPTAGSDRVSTSSRPSVWPFRVSNWTAVRKQCQDCYPEHSGVYGENLALFFTSTQWKLSLQRSAQMGALWSGFVFKLSLCYSFRPRYNFVFSVVYTVWELLYFLTWLTTAESFFF